MSSRSPDSGVRSLILLSGRYSVRSFVRDFTNDRSVIPQLVSERVRRLYSDEISARSCELSVRPLRSKLSVSGSTVLPATTVVRPPWAGAAVATSVVGAGEGSAVSAGRK